MREVRSGCNIEEVSSDKLLCRNGMREPERINCAACLLGVRPRSACADIGDIAPAESSGSEMGERELIEPQPGRAGAGEIWVVVFVLQSLSHALKEGI